MLSPCYLRPGTKGNNELAIEQNAETTGLDIHPRYAELPDRGVNNRQKRLFLESLHSTLTTDAVNERSLSLRPTSFLLIASLSDREKPQKLS